MTKKIKAKMNFQSAVKLVPASADQGDTGVESLVDACKQCGFLKDHKVRTKDELPNPRKVQYLTIADVIDLTDRQVMAVAQALHRKGIKRVGDLLDKHPSKIFNDLKVTDTQKLRFVVAIENAGVRFTPSTKHHPSPKI